MDYMYNACSTTARRGALDWAKEFEKINLPVFERLYESVKNGSETRRSLEFNGRSTYREDLAKELKEIDEQEIWRAGALLFVVCSSGLLANYPLRQGRPLPPPGQAVIDSSQACFLAEHTQKHLRGALLDRWFTTTLELIPSGPISRPECHQDARSLLDLQGSMSTLSLSCPCSVVFRKGMDLGKAHMERTMVQPCCRC